MQIDQFVRHGGHAFDGQCCQCGVAPLVLESGKIARLHLDAFARNLQQTVLVNMPAQSFRQGERLEDLEALDMLPDVAGIRFAW